MTKQSSDAPIATIELMKSAEEKQEYNEMENFQTFPETPAFKESSIVSEKTLFLSPLVDKMSTEEFQEYNEKETFHKTPKTPAFKEPSIMEENQNANITAAYATVNQTPGKLISTLKK